MKKTSLALGQEALKSGSKIVSDVWKNGDLSSAQKRRGKEFINNVSNRMADHMFGSGYVNSLGVQRKQLKRSASGKKTSSAKKKKKTVKAKTKKGKTKKGQARKKTVKKRTKQTIQDIFS